jgi:chromosome segregation ATPase
MEQNIKFKDKELENKKEDLVHTKKEIDNLNEKIKMNQMETEELIKKINSLESKVKEVESSPKILDSIRDLMVHKGFITDREIDNIFKEFE